MPWSFGLGRVAADAEDEVAWYRLAQVQKLLGNVADQQRALAEFRRLHQQVNQQKLIEKVFSPTEVTKQELDPNASSQVQP